MPIFSFFKSIKHAFFNGIKMHEDYLDARWRTLKEDDFRYALSVNKEHKWLNKYSCQFDETILNVVQTREERGLFSTLLRNFKYITKQKSDNNVRLIANHINNVWKCDKEQTLIMAVHKMSNPHADGSDKLLYDLQKEMTDWSTRKFIKHFDDQNKKALSYPNVILCDDFIGTGSTMQKRVQALLNNNVQGQRIYVVALGALSEAFNNLSTIAEVYVPEIVENFDIDRDSRSRNLMIGMEGKLGDKYKGENLTKVSFGYRRSRALYCNEDYRIPNNVFPIFWWGILKDKTPLFSIFLRT